MSNIILGYIFPDIIVFVEVVEPEVEILVFESFLRSVDDVTAIMWSQYLWANWLYFMKKKKKI